MYKEHLTKVQNNLIGGIAGGGLAFWAAKNMATLAICMLWQVLPL
jgi:hypothetical protein